MTNTIDYEINSILDKLEDNLGFTPSETEYMISLLNALFNKYYEGDRVSYRHWQNDFPGGHSRFNLIIKILSTLKWVKAIVANNYATIEINEAKLLEYHSAKELQGLRLKALVKNKTMDITLPSSNNKSNIRMPSSAGGTTKITMIDNIIREGFRLSGNVAFSLDTKYLEKYYDEFHHEITKGLQDLEEKESNDSKRKPLSKVDYREIVKGVFNYYLKDDREYTFGENVSDSRGRAIYECLRKVGNPISSKLFRSILKVKPAKIDEEMLGYIYESIADLSGAKFSTVNEKREAGKHNYNKRAISSELYETIWLERIYDDLDKYYEDSNHEWTTALEIDVNSSMLTNMSILLNNHDMMKQCNLVYGQEEIYDPWNVEGVERKALKKALTPILYGSSAKLRNFLADEEGNIDYDQVIAINEELKHGKYKQALQFRDFILNNCMTKPEMQVLIADENFKIVCNRFKWDTIDNTESVLCYDSITNNFIPITRNVKRVPDITTFNLYMVTLLLHNIDSQIANHICENVPCLPIHDAFIMHPRYIAKAKKAYLNKISDIYLNRKEILDNYFLSIGITEPYKHNSCEELELSSNSLR